MIQLILIIDLSTCGSIRPPQTKKYNLFSHGGKCAQAQIAVCLYIVFTSPHTRFVNKWCKMDLVLSRKRAMFCRHGRAIESQQEVDWRPSQSHIKKGSLNERRRKCLWPSLAIPSFLPKKKMRLNISKMLRTSIAIAAWVLLWIWSTLLLSPASSFPFIWNEKDQLC